AFSNKNNVIENNYIKNGGYGVYLVNANSYTNDRNNIVRYNRFEGQGADAIVALGQVSPQITGNKIISGSGSDYYSGITISSCSGDILVNKNKIEVLRGTSGITFENTKCTPTQNGIIANNFVTIKGSTNNFGIQLTSCEYIGVYFNSVLNTSTGLTASAYKSSNCKYHSVVNNIFSNTGMGYASTFDDVSNALLSDNNNYFVTGTKVF